MDKDTLITAALSRFRAEVDADIDENKHGGVSWWVGDLGKDESGLLTSYLHALVSGVEQSIDDAAFAIGEFADSQKAWNSHAGVLAASGGKYGIGFLPSIYDNPTLLHRTRLMTLFSEQCLSSLVTALDRIAALGLIASAHSFKRSSVFKSSWETFAEATRNLHPSRDSSGLSTASVTPDSEISAALIRVAAIPLNPDKYGPRDWLVWMRETRNSQVHRGQTIRPVLSETRNRAPYFYHNIFWRDPSKFYLQSLAARDRVTTKQKQDPTTLLIVEDPVSVMEGLRASTCELISDLLQRLAELWVARRNAPQALPQPSSQWPSIDSEASTQFDGYGSVLKINPSTVVVNPANSRLFRIGGVFDE